MVEKLKRTLYKLIQITLRGGSLNEMVGYDLSNAITNYDYDSIGSKNRGLLEKFFDNFIDELPQVLIVNPKIPDRELQEFSILWNELLSKRGANAIAQDIELEPVYNGVTPEIMELLNDCKSFLSEGNTNTTQIKLLGRIEKYISNE